MLNLEKAVAYIMTELEKVKQGTEALESSETDTWVASPDCESAGRLAVGPRCSPAAGQRGYQPRAG
jgi:hypothetical protein